MPNDSQRIGYKRRLTVLASLAFLAAGQARTGDWILLFNGKDLDGWYTYLPSTGKNVDPKGVFRVHDGMVHILGTPVTGEKQEFGYMATEKQFSNCRIRLQYKWGQKRFPPRENTFRDSGLLYYFVGPDKVWPRSVECQIMETDTGSFYLIDGVSITTTVESQQNRKYSENGISVTETGRPIGRIIRNAEWNTVEVILDGDSVTHMINGMVANRGRKLSQPDPLQPERSIPLASGRILLQAEGAEVFLPQHRGAGSWKMTASESSRNGLTFTWARRL
jgi:hypothetical protein